jgi:uncharacterized protein YbaP (TraB family)
MKRSSLFTLLLLGLGALATVTTNGQTKANQDPPSLLYEVRGKGLARPSYILGTFHAVCPSDMVPFETLDPYLTRTDQVLMEVDLDDPSELGSLAAGVLIPGGKTWKDFLTPAQFAKVDAMTMSMLGYSAENVKAIKPMMLSVLIVTSPKVVGCTPNTYDLSLMQIAAVKKKPVIGLETVAEQFAMIDSKPIARQAKELYEMSLDPQKSIRQFKQLSAAYKSRNTDKLVEISAEQMRDDKAFAKRLLDDRNVKWVPKIEGLIKTKPTFIAVGAAHLGGEKGLIRLLRSRGYDVRPIKL